MFKVAIASQKGGSGKSSTARALAVLAQERGATALLDLDPQQTSAKWSKRREAAEPSVTALRYDELNRTLLALEKRGTAWVIMDTPPAHDDTRSVLTAVRAADLVIIPVRPTGDDLEAVSTTLSMVRKEEKKFSFVVTQALRNRLLLQAMTALSRHGPIAGEPIHMRTAWPEAHARGLTVTEAEPKGKASDEIKSVWHSILEEVNHV